MGIAKGRRCSRPWGFSNGQYRAGPGPCREQGMDKCQGFAHLWMGVHLEPEWKILGSALGWGRGKGQGGSVVRVAPGPASA